MIGRGRDVQLVPDEAVGLNRSTTDYYQGQTQDIQQTKDSKQHA